MYHPHPDTITQVARYHDYKIYYGYDVGVLLSCMRVLIPREKDIGVLVGMVRVCVGVLAGYRDGWVEMRRG